MATFQTSNGIQVLIDEEDLPYVLRYRWFGKRANSAVKRYYVCRKRRAHESGPQTIYLHRELIKPADGLEVDHINGNSLDNRRCNLREATKSQNIANCKSVAVNFSGFRGVCRHRKLFRAQIESKGVRLNGPCRQTPIHAAFDYDRAAVKIFGEFASLNFPCARAAISRALGEGENT